MPFRTEHNRQSKGEELAARLLQTALRAGDLRHHRIEAIKKHNLVLGMDFPYIYEGLCSLTEDEIRHFDPVFPVDTEEHQRLYAGFCSPRNEHLPRARELKDDASDHAHELSDRRTQYKRDNHVSRSKGEELKYERKFRHRRCGQTVHFRRDRTPPHKFRE